MVSRIVVECGGTHPRADVRASGSRSPRRHHAQHAILIISKRANFPLPPNFRDPRFFCEAKKPTVQLHTDADAAFQTLRYGYSAGTPLAVLTDFEQLHIFDCRAKPSIDTALFIIFRVTFATIKSAGENLRAWKKAR